MHYVLVVLMAILGAMFPGFLVKAIKSTDKNEADGALFGARVILGMLMVLLQEKTISLREGMKLRKTQLSYRLKKMNGNVRKDGKIWNTGVELLKYFAGLNSNQNGQYGQIYAEKFTSACLICRVFYGKMKAQ